MKISVFIITLILSLNVSAQEIIYNLSDFKSLSVIGNFEVEIIQSDRNVAVVDINNEEEVKKDNILFTYAAEKLTIKYQGSFIKDIEIKIRIYYANTIQEIEARRGVQIRVENAGKFTEKTVFKAENGGKLLIKNIEASEVSAEISKGGSIRISGKADSFTAKIVAGGTIGGKDLEAKLVNAKVNMGGEITCNPLESLLAQVTSGGSIHYIGKPKLVDKKVTLGGNIDKL